MTGPLSIGQALDLGTQYAMAGDHRNAAGLFKGVLEHDPESFEAMQRLGSSLFELGFVYEAFWWFYRGIKIEPKNPSAQINYGSCLSQLGHPEEALDHLRRAVAYAHKRPNASRALMALVYNGLGNTLHRLGKYKEAAAALDRGIEAAPDDPFPHYNRGICLRDLNCYEQAIEDLDLSLALDARGPRAESVSRINVSDVRYNRGIIKLSLGHLREGFQDYEYRLTSSENIKPNFGLPAEKKWRGENLAGRTILVWCEQGFGDTIQFARFLPRLVGMAGRVQLVAQTSLRDFIKVPGVEVLPGGASIEHIDHWVAMMSLPLMFGLEREDQIPEPWFPDIPNDLLANSAKWLDTLRTGPDGKPKLHVGVCWSGNFKHKNDAHRSVRFNLFKRLFDAPNCVFVSLQQVREEDKQAVSDSQLQLPEIRSWYDAAALTMFLDCVVTVDSAMAHLSGSIGTPTWTLIPGFSTDWRWQTERLDCPWYPMMTLYRQDKIGDWSATLGRVRTNLANAAHSLAHAI